MTAGACAIAGFLIVAASARWSSRILDRPPFLRPNHRGAQIPGMLGALLVLPLVAVGGAVAPLEDAPPVAMAGIAFAALGLADDLFGSRRAGGFAGHLRSLLRGEPTTGALKAFGGAAVGLVVAAWLGERGPWILPGGAVVALSANLANLLDLRPGRTAKAWLVPAAAVFAARPPDGAFAVLAALGGGVLAWLPVDLRERGMLGDTGSNLLGAVAGAGAVSALGHAGQLWTLGALVALTAASEVVSFSRVIDAVPPLRTLDRLGRQA